jgi:dihydroflavonol-4-reductase
MDKRIAVVTGANGFVGSHLVDHLLEKNYEVRCLVRKSSDLKWLKEKEVEIFATGLLDKEGLRRAFNGADYIYHVAGVVKSKTPEGYFKGNVEITRNLLETALEFKEGLKRFLVVSSQTAGGPSLSGIPITEADECKPITTYGRSKLEQEVTALLFKEKLPITICRAPAVYGERDTEIFIFFDTFNKGLMTTIGFDKKVISLIHVRDLVEGLVMAAESDKTMGEVYYVSSEQYYTWDEVGEATALATGKKPFKVKVPHSVVYLIATIAQGLSVFKKSPATLNIEKAKDITRRSWICDAQKSARDFGFRQKISLEEGIKRTVEWYRQQGWIK